MDLPLPQRSRHLLALCIAALPSLSQAQAPLADDRWTFEATPYFWAAGMNGQTRIGARTPTVNVDADFSDVWKDLDFGAMGSFEARKGRWGVLFDAIYVKLGQTSDPLAGGDLGTARMKVAQTILQLAGAYRVLDSPTTPVDFLAGVRYTNLDSDLDFSPNRFPREDVHRSANKAWTDGFVGLRATYAITDKWSLLGYADVGAGGTKYSWQLIAGVNYNFTETVVGKFGYRIIKMDYESNDFLYNMKTEGLFVGVGIKF